MGGLAAKGMQALGEVAVGFGMRWQEFFGVSLRLEGVTLRRVATMEEGRGRLKRGLLLFGVLLGALASSRGRGAGQGDREQLETRRLSSHETCIAAVLLSCFLVAYRMGCGDRRMMSESDAKPQRVPGTGEF